jgi:carbonic anhydrase
MHKHLMLIPLACIAVAAGCAERHGEEPAPRAKSSPETRAEAPAKAEAEAAAAAAAAAKAKTADAHVASGPSPLEAVARMSAGNARFATGRRGRSADASDDAKERTATAGGQHPFAAVLTCADSRVPPELLFDQSIGDLFVVRNAGNVAEPVGEGSLEYGVEHLGIRLVVVLGHGSCGAVKAVTGTAGDLPGNLVHIQRNMAGLRDYAEQLKKTGYADIVAACVERNAGDQAAALLRESAVLRAAVASGNLAVVPAVYDLDSGLVEFMAPALADAGGGEAKPTAAKH